MTLQCTTLQYMEICSNNFLVKKMLEKLLNFDVSKINYAYRNVLQYMYVHSELCMETFLPQIIACKAAIERTNYD